MRQTTIHFGCLYGWRTDEKTDYVISRTENS